MIDPIIRREFLRRSAFAGIGSLMVGAVDAGALSANSPVKADSLTGIPDRKSKILQADVAVIGGGMSGVCAALAAARNGAKTILVQDRPVLGGNSSSEVRLHIRGADNSGVADSREGGIIEELLLENQVRNPQRSATMWDLTLWEKTHYQSGLTTLLNTVMTGCTVDNGRIRSVDCYRLRTESPHKIEASFFIDCTGNGTLGYLAGNPYRVGQESRDEFDESMAPREAKPYTQGSSLLFQARDHGKPMPFTKPWWAHTYRTEKEIARDHSSIEHGFWWMEWGGMLDIIRDDDRITEEVLKILFGVWDHIKNHGDHRADNWALEWFGALPGRRESRRLMGRYIMRQDDLTSGRVFTDEVAFGGWGVDHHDERGFDYKGGDFYYNNEVPLYSIPLSSLYSDKLKNLFFGGRAVSGTHIAFCSNRVMGTCSVIGQGAGTTAAYCAKRGADPETLSENDLALIKQTLLKDDSYLLGTRGRDPQDLARTAKISAGSARPMCDPDNVVDGISRGVGGGSHQWRSKDLGQDNAWLELDFGRNIRCSELHLAFDTNYSRMVCLTHEDRTNAKMVPGPQPETVKDYRIEAFVDGGWKVVEDVKDNYLRKKIHDLGDLNLSRLRIVVTATNGVPEARIFEVRCYA